MRARADVRSRRAVCFLPSCASPQAAVRFSPSAMSADEGCSCVSAAAAAVAATASVRDVVPPLPPSPPRTVLRPIPPPRPPVHCVRGVCMSVLSVFVLLSVGVRAVISHFSLSRPSGVGRPPPWRHSVAAVARRFRRRWPRWRGACGGRARRWKSATCAVRVAIGSGDLPRPAAGGGATWRRARATWRRENAIECCFIAAVNKLPVVGYSLLISLAFCQPTRPASFTATYFLITNIVDNSCFVQLWHSKLPLLTLVY